MIWQIFAAAALITAVAFGVMQTAKISLQANELVMKDKAGRMLNEANVQIRGLITDADEDGFIEAPLPVLWDAWPSGSGKVPVGVQHTTDPWGTYFAYCSWDNGSTVAAGRIAGSTNTAHNAYAILSAGPNRTFQTTCADLETGDAPHGDDGARAASQNDLVVGFGAKFWGDPALTVAHLPATAPEGQIRPVLAAAGKLYQYYEATDWMPMAGLSVVPEGTISRYGADMNGGMPQTVSLSIAGLGVIDGSGRVLYAGGVSTFNTLSFQSATLLPTGVTASALTAYTRPGGVLSDSASGFTGEANCPAIIQLDGTVSRVVANAPDSPCVPGNYTTYQGDAYTSIAAVGRIVRIVGLNSTPWGPIAPSIEGMPNWAITSGGKLLSCWYNSAESAAMQKRCRLSARSDYVDVGGEYSIAGLPPWALTNANQLEGNSTLGGVRAFAVGPGHGATVQAIRTDGSLSTYTGAWTHNILTGVRGVATINTCSIAVLDDGRLLSNGTSCVGAYLPTNWSQDATVPLVNGQNAVVAGWLVLNNVVVKLNNGTLWVKGENKYGHLGVGHVAAVSNWTKIL